MPRQWDFGNVTELTITVSGVVFQVNVTLNVANNESYGNAVIPTPGWGGTIAIARSSTANQAIFLTTHERNC